MMMKPGQKKGAGQKTLLSELLTWSVALKDILKEAPSGIVSFKCLRAGFVKVMMHKPTANPKYGEHMKCLLRSHFHFTSWSLRELHEKRIEKHCVASCW